MVLMHTCACGSMLLRGQALHVVQLGELAAVVGRRVGHELLVRLLAEVARIDQEQDALGAAELEQAVDRGDGGEGLAGAGGHVHQGAGLVQRQRFLQPGDGADLAVAQVCVRAAPAFARQGGGAGCRAAPAIRPDVAGLKKWKISRERGAGSAPSVKRMIWPVLSNRKRSGVLSLRHLSLALA